MAKKLTGKALEKFEAERDVWWQEVLDGVRELKAGGGKRTKVEAKSHIVRVRLKSGLSQAQFAAALGFQAHLGKVGARTSQTFWRRQATLEDRRSSSRSSD
jgi:hypothetical protein